MTLKALLGLLPQKMTVTGSVRLDGQELLGRSERSMSAVRGKSLAFIPQDAMAALQPDPAHRQPAGRGVPAPPGPG